MYTVVVSGVIVATYGAGKCQMAMLVAQMMGGKVYRTIG